MISPRSFGNTGLTVPIIGLGAGAIGGEQVSDSQVEELLHGADDLGVHLIDTAPSYGESEGRIGRFLSGRRHRFILSTKLGYGVPGTQDWTPDCIRGGIEQALRRLRTDYIDIIHFHSCSKQILQHSGIIEVLLRAKEAGYVRCLAYSGENEALEYAIHCGHFDSVQLSVNVTDQRCITGALAGAKGRHLGVIAKRSMGNTPWRFSERPDRPDQGEYWQRFQQMGLHLWPVPWPQLSLRFSAHQPGVHCSLVGTGSIKHLEANVLALRSGPLEAEMLEQLRLAFNKNDDNWTGLI